MPRAPRVGMADQERGGEAGPLSDGDGVDRIEGEIDLLHHPRDEEREIAQVLAAGHLGHHAAEGPVQVDLRADDLGQDVGGEGIGLHQGDGGFVAGGFDAENAHERSLYRKGRRWSMADVSLKLYFPIPSS